MLGSGDNCATPVSALAAASRACIVPKNVSREARGSLLPFLKVEISWIHQKTVRIYNRCFLITTEGICSIFWSVSVDMRVRAHLNLCSVITSDKSESLV